MESHFRQYSIYRQIETAIREHNEQLICSLCQKLTTQEIYTLCMDNRGIYKILRDNVKYSYPGILAYFIQKKKTVSAIRLISLMPAEQLANDFPICVAIQKHDIPMVKKLLPYISDICTTILDTLKSYNHPDIWKIIASHNNITPEVKVNLILLSNNIELISKLLSDGYTKIQLIQVAIQQKLSIQHILKCSGELDYTVELCYQAADAGIQVLDMLLRHIQPNIQLLDDLFTRQVYENIQVFIDLGLQLKEYPDMFIRYIEYEPSIIRINTKIGMNNYQTIIKQFLDHGIDPNYNQALVKSTNNWCINYIDILLQAGADPTIDNHLAFRSVIKEDNHHNIDIFYKWYETHQVVIPSVFTILNTNQCIVNTRQSLLTLQPMIGSCLAYGNPKDGYYCLSIDDLTTQFKLGDYRNPYNHNQVFDMTDLYSIAYLLQTNEETFTENQIEEYNYFMINCQLREVALNDDIMYLKQLNNKQDLTQLFTYLFEIGMYCRQWKGPGHDYPLHRKQTNKEYDVGTDEEIKLSQRVQNIHQKYIELVKQISDERLLTIYESLPAKQILSGNIEHTNENIKQIYEKTITTDEYCIRGMSAVFVITGAYYYKIICEREFDGYTLSNKLDEIQ